MRVTTRLTTQLPGDFFFYLVAEITEPSAAKDNFPGESRVFPNPAGDKLYLNLMLNESIETTAQIVNAMGQVVLNKQLGQVAAGNHQFPFEVAALPKGVYFLQLYSDKGIKTAKFVKA
jgi:hypothetical protein